jgi:hypothetical protein
MYENSILQVAMSTLNKVKVEVFAPMFDGVLVYNDNWNDEMLSEVTDAVELEFKGLNMKWSIKEHDDEIQMPFEWEPPVDKEEDEPSSPFEAGKLLMRLHPHYVTCRDELYVWLDHTGRWSNSRTARLAVAQKFHLKLGKYATDTNKFSNMDTQMKSMNIDDDFIDRTQDSSLGYLLFPDCIWDSRNGRTIPFTPDIVFHVQMPNEYPRDVTQEDMDFVDKVLFIDPLGSVVGKYRRIELAKSIVGIVGKVARTSVGLTNNGKTLLGCTLKDALGQYYGDFDAAALLVRKQGGGGDEAQRFRPFFLLRWCRVAMSQELKADTSSIVDSSFLKKLSSAGDSLIGRVHGGLETTFRPHYTLDINCNAMFEVDIRDEALYERIKVIGYDRQFFLPDQRSDKEVFNDDGSLKSERIRRADDTLKDKLRQKRYLQALVALLIKTFEEWSRSSDKDWVPDEVNIAKVDHFGESNEGSVIDTFLQSYEITNDENDYVSNAELKAWLQASKVTVTHRTLSRAIKYYVDNADFPTDQTVYTRTTRDKVSQWFWFGIRRIPDGDADSGMEFGRIV